MNKEISYIKYKIKFTPDTDKDTRLKIVERIRECPECEDMFAKNQGDTWWDTLVPDMRKVSDVFPTHLLTVYSHEEPKGTIWIRYFLAGKMQVETVKTFFPPFDESKLQ
jgi:hypothetical protein